MARYCVLCGRCNVIHARQKRSFLNTYRMTTTTTLQEWFLQSPKVFVTFCVPRVIVPSSASSFSIVFVTWFRSPAKEKQQSYVCPIGVLKWNLVPSPSLARSSMAWPPLRVEHWGWLMSDKRLAICQNRNTDFCITAYSIWHWLQVSIKILLYPACPLELHPECDPKAKSHQLLGQRRGESGPQRRAARGREMERAGASWPSGRGLPCGGWGWRLYCTASPTSCWTQGQHPGSGPSLAWPWWQRLTVALALPCSFPKPPGPHVQCFLGGAVAPRWGWYHQF